MPVELPAAIRSFGGSVFEPPGGPGGSKTIGQPIVEEFATHISADANVLDEDETTGAKTFRYINTGTNHVSLAFTYAWLATTDVGGVWACLEFLDWQLRRQREGRG